MENTEPQKVCRAPAQQENMQQGHSRTLKDRPQMANSYTETEAQKAAARTQEEHGTSHNDRGRVRGCTTVEANLD